MLMTKRKDAMTACVRALLVALTLLAFLCAASARAESDGMLRVKLARLGSPSAIQMKADCDYYLAADPSVRIPADTEMTVSASGGNLALTASGQTVLLGPSARLMRSAPGTCGLRFLSPALSNRFCGDLSISASSDVIVTVLHIYVEDYLYGVVGYEMPPSSGLEALKAQAVVARNYALRQKAARSGSSYDLSDSGDALTYRGYNTASEYAQSIQAVDATRGEVLYYGDSPATCYYCESNGGQTESSANVTGTALPYSSVWDDPYDFESAGAKKTASLRKDASNLNPQLALALADGAAAQVTQMGFTSAAEGVRINAIEDIQVGDARYPAPSRLHKYLIFRLSASVTTANGDTRMVSVSVAIPTYGALEDWYQLGINADDNETVWVVETDKTFEITFRRSGSGLGMSQRGAQMMARSGRTCAEILDYYYPGTTPRTLSLADTTEDSQAVEAAATPATEPIATARLSQKAELYERADESGSVLNLLPAGATVDVYAVQEDWAAVSSGSLYGFLRTDALTSFALNGTTATQVLNETLARVNADSVDVLQLPVATAKLLIRLSSGATVNLNAYTDQWAMITTAEGVTGFIPRSALTLQAGSAQLAEGDIVAAEENLYALLTEDAGLYINSDDSVEPRVVLEKGAYVMVLAYNQVWAYVRTTNNETGYMKLSCLSPVQDVPQDVDPDLTDGGEITVVQSVELRYVAEDTLNLYETYSTDSEILATLTRGEEVQLGAYNTRWACVRANGLTGFVLRSGLTEQSPLGEQMQAIDGGDITVVHGRQYATVVREGAKLYATWNEQGDVLATLVQGDVVQLGAYNTRWACVRIDGVTGFMLLTDLEASASDAPDEDTGISYLECEAATTAAVGLYEDADLSGEPIAQLAEGTQVHVFAYNRRSAYVEYNGQKGFVALRFLRKLS